MIWFACKNCGKRHKQPDDAAGSLVFCECGRPNRVPWDSTVSADEDDRPRPQEAPARRQTRRRPRDPDHCLNHEAAASEAVCPDCHEAFCPRCLVEFRGERLCAPCKNHRVRKLQRPSRIGGLAIGALATGLGSAPLVFCVTIVPMPSGSPGAMLAGAVVGMVIGASALMLGLAGLRQAESKPSMGGRGLAMTGAACGLAGLLWSLSLAVLLASRLMQG
jgi:hypothetical protein